MSAVGIFNFSFTYYSLWFQVATPLIRLPTFGMACGGSFSTYFCATQITEYVDKVVAAMTDRQELLVKYDCLQGEMTQLKT